MQATAPTPVKPGRRLGQVAADLTAFIRHVMLSAGKDFFQAVDDLGLSLSQLKSLQVLFEADDDLSVKVLAERLGLSTAAASRAVDGLVIRGLVAREEDGDDRRHKRLSLTPAGDQLLAALMAVRIADLKLFLAHLEPAELDALAAGIAPIVARADVAELPEAVTKAVR